MKSEEKKAKYICIFWGGMLILITLGNIFFPFIKKQYMSYREKIYIDENSSGEDFLNSLEEDADSTYRGKKHPTPEELIRGPTK